MSVNGTQTTFSERKNIVFVGGYQHPPNVDSAKYLVSDIMPLLRTRLPGVKLHIVGSKPPAVVQALACDDIIVTGFVEDLVPVLDSMRVFVRHCVMGLV